MTQSLLKVLCRHTQVTIFRAHADTDFARAHRAQLAWIDTFRVHNFICCTKCHAVLDFSRFEHVYGELTEQPT